MQVDHFLGRIDARISYVPVGSGIGMTRLISLLGIAFVDMNAGNRNTARNHRIAQHGRER